MNTPEQEPERDGEIEPTELDEQGLPPSTTTLKAPDWSVQVFKSERSIFELHRRYKRGGVQLDPGFQRGDVWKAEARSRLIESVLAQIPLPAIYLSEEDRERLLVVDGRQRLTTLFRFLDGGFALHGLQLLPQYDGKHFSDLDARMRRRVEDTMLTVFSIQAGSDPKVKFHLFERLNRGGEWLRAQEIRNGIYRGPGLERVQALGRQEGLFRQVAGARWTYRHMKADELVLRCFALLLNPLADYPGTMEAFLNDTLVRMNGMPTAELDALQERVVQSLKCCEAGFNGHPFIRYVPERLEWGSHLNLAVMDVQMVGFDVVRYPPAFWKARSRPLMAELAGLHISDPYFLGAVLYSTSARAQLTYRVNTWLGKLNNVADTEP